jgi:hypothetical protein
VYDFVQRIFGSWDENTLEARMKFSTLPKFKVVRDFGLDAVILRHYLFVLPFI